MDRQPRPLGTTYLGLLYHNNPNQQTKTNLIRHLTNSYVQNNYQINGQNLSIEEYSKYIQIDGALIWEMITEYGINSFHLYDRDGENKMVEAMLGMAIKGILDDRTLAMKQYSILAASQGNTYKPFISAEVTKSIKLLSDTSALMSNFVKTLMPSNPNQLSVIFNQQNNTGEGQQKGITTDEVVMLMKAHNVIPTTQSLEAQNALYEEYQLDDAPEVNAMLQSNADTSREGLTLNKITQLPLRDEGTNEEGHIDRRALEEFSIDFDEDEI